MRRIEELEDEMGELIEKNNELTQIVKLY